jgi:hypothetical protein
VTKNTILLGVGFTEKGFWGPLIGAHPEQKFFQHYFLA